MNEPIKAELKSMDVADDKRRQLAQLFPEVITETRTDDGRLTYTMNFEKLKAVLGQFSSILENQKERYGMTWPGKNECLKIIQQPSIATLKPCREESVNFDTTENLFIEGDNLEVLKLLQKAYYGKIKMIYIDPPYNTGKEFIYPDKYSESLDTYLAYTGQVDSEGRKFSTNTEAEGRFHSRWLNMMLPRLYLAKNLLREDGVLFISIDDNEVKNLREICNEIFGEENFLAQVVWQKIHSTKNDAKYFSDTHEYVFVYAKNIEVVQIKLLPRTQKMDSRFANPDNDPRGAWSSGDLVANEERKDGRFEIVGPTGASFNVPEGKHWVYSRENLLKYIQEGRISFGKSGDAFPRLKRYLSEVQQGRKCDTIWRSEEVGHNQESMREVKSLFDDNGLFDNPKPVRLLSRCLQLVSEKADIILDFFSGSSTTAHAVLDMNRQDGGNRKFIMVQLPEPCDERSEAYKAGYKTIADIGKDRIRRVIKKFKTEDSGKLDLDDAKKQDRGFRVYKLGRSNFKVWDGEKAARAPETISNQLELHEQHIDPNAAPEDILYELLLKAGFPLTTKVEKVPMAGKDIFSIADGALLICLEREITKELIKTMAAADPFQVICLDEGFKGNDQLKTNAVQTFKARGQGKDKEAGTIFRTV
ncbi:MAG: site-specific DNA-methyltransferase [Planctomycetes bacterium]|nr:site-specific DNA-methyltransferase [Planctomycetota bacterium]